MYLTRTLLLLMMGFLVFMMVVYPGLYDSRETAVALSHYVQAPSKATEMEVKKARESDRKSIAIIELFPAAIFGACLYAFIRAGKAAARRTAELGDQPTNLSVPPPGRSKSVGGPPSAG